MSHTYEQEEPDMSESDFDESDYDMDYVGVGWQEQSEDEEEMVNVEEEEGVEEEVVPAEEVEDMEEDEDDNANFDRRGRKSKLRSAIWVTAATKVNGKAQCSVCKQTYVCPRGNTTNIRTHVKARHPGSEECKAFLALEKARKDEKKKKKKPKVTMRDFVTIKKAISKTENVKMTNSVVDFLVQTNTSIQMVENPAFRKMLFNFHSGYIAPSRTTIMKLIEKKVVDAETALAKEIKEDIVDTKTVSVTTDGGPSHDQNKTKKNSITVSRITSNWKLKTDTLGLEVAVGSQTGEVLRTVVKRRLDKFGMGEGEEGWSINMTTDDASAPRSARAPNRHAGVGLHVKYDTACLDHQFHLLVRKLRFLKILI